jgi:hypothetical protein
MHALNERSENQRRGSQIYAVGRRCSKTSGDLRQKVPKLDRLGIRRRNYRGSGLQ